MAQKNDLLAEVAEDGIDDDVCSRQYAFGSLTSPSDDYDTNIRCIAEYCFEMHGLMKAIFDQMPVLEYQMRVGQRSATQQGMLLASLEVKDPEPS